MDGPRIFDFWMNPKNLRNKNPRSKYELASHNVQFMDVANCGYDTWLI